MVEHSPSSFYESQQFASPEEELRFLREQVERKEKELKVAQKSYEREQVIQETIQEHKAQPSQDILAEHYRLEESELKELVPHLAPEPHDAQIKRLLELVDEKGIRNVLSVLEKMENPHVDDDFHRVLVQYVKEGMPVAGLKLKGNMWRVLNMTLFEITLPELVPQETKYPPKHLREIISSMEQFYAGMLSVSDRKTLGQYHFSMEIAVSNLSNEIIFYVAIPNQKIDLFEKQLLSIFPNAQMYEQKNDYNIFVENGVSLGAYATLTEHPILPLRTYQSFDYDPLNIILNTFSKIEKTGAGAALQILFNPVGNTYAKQFRKLYQRIEEGKTYKEAIAGPSKLTKEIFGSFGRALTEVTTGKVTEEKEKPKEDFLEREQRVDEAMLENIRSKLSTPILDANIRIVVSAATKVRAESLLADIESSFNQFTNPHRGNSFRFKRTKWFNQKKLLKKFSFREFSTQYALPLNLSELTGILHFPPTGIKTAHQFRQAKAGTAPAPVSLPQEGILLGINRVRNIETPVYFTRPDRLRHFYTIGQTGTGKTTLLKNMIAQDIATGEGVCMIDPHGSDVQDILSMIPEERYKDVIYFDPGYTKRVMGLNMLEYDTAFPEQKTFVVNELFSIFQKLYAAIPESMGPMFEQYFRNATALVLEDPESGNTLLDISRVLSNVSYRQLKLSRSRNPVVNQFWKEIAAKAGGEASLQNIVPYITSKFDVFVANDIMRPIIAQSRSSLNLRRIMDERKILLVNLAKGRLGDINSNLIGLILVGKILMAALSRVDSLRLGLPPFYLYIDEFHNVTTDSIATILSEARKYGLSLSMAHQFIKQLEDPIRNAVLGNVGTMAVFRTGPEDAEFLEKQFQPVFTMNDIMNIDNYNAYVRLLAHGAPIKPFSMGILPPPEGNIEKIEYLKQLSYDTYGRDRTEVEDEILRTYS